MTHNNIPSNVPGPWQHYVAVAHQSGFSEDSTAPRKSRKTYKYSAWDSSRSPLFVKLVDTFSQHYTYQDPRIAGFYADGVVSEEEKLFVSMLKSASNGTFNQFQDSSDIFVKFIVHYSKKNVFLVTDVISELNNNMHSFLGNPSNEDIVNIGGMAWENRHAIINKLSLRCIGNTTYKTPDFIANVTTWVVSMLDLIFNIKSDLESRHMAVEAIRSVLSSISESGIPQFINAPLSYACKNGHLIGLRDSDLDGHILKSSLIESFEFSAIIENKGTFVLADNALAWVGFDERTVYRHCLGAGSSDLIAYVLVPLSSSVMLVGRNKSFTGDIPSNLDLNKLVVSAAHSSYISDSSHNEDLLEFVSESKANPTPFFTVSSFYEWIPSLINQSYNFYEGISDSIGGDLSDFDKLEFIRSLDSIFLSNVTRGHCALNSGIPHLISRGSLNPAVFKLRIKRKTGLWKMVPATQNEVLVKCGEHLDLFVHFTGISELNVKSVFSLVFNTSIFANTLGCSDIQHVTSVPMLSPSSSQHSFRYYFSYPIYCCIEGIHLLVLTAENESGVNVAVRLIRVRVVR